MKRLMISMLLCCSPLAFGLIGELIEDIKHGVHDAAHATGNLLHHSRHEHFVLPTPGFKVEPNGVLVYFNNVVPADNGVMYAIRVINDHELELKHQDFTALFSFNAANKTLKTQVFAQEEEFFHEADYHTTERFSSASQEIEFMLQAPIDITKPKIEYNEHTGVLDVFFPYKS